MSSDLPRGAAVIGQAGGPTAVINQSLVGVVEGLRKVDAVTKILGARHAVRGMVEDAFIDLTDTPQATLDAVANTPSAALGSTRDKPDAAYCARIFESLRKRDVRYFFYIGGNDSSDTCRLVNESATAEGYDLRCIHVPKTIDNDLMENDHTPGFASAARFVATAFMGDNLDNAAIPGVKINVVMGRHAGFLTAASALARRREDDGPHLIYCPEQPFDEQRFVADVQAVVEKRGRCLIAVSEGISDANGEPIATKLVENVEKDAHGNVQLSGTGALGDLLADHLKRAMKTSSGKPPRVRADTFGYAQRYWPDASPVDQCEARGAGQFAVKCVSEGAKAGSVAITRESSSPYKGGFKLVKLTDVAAKTRHMPKEFFKGHSDVSGAFLDYCRPLVGDLPEFARL